jgi:hypothetical protein
MIIKIYQTFYESIFRKTGCSTDFGTIRVKCTAFRPAMPSAIRGDRAEKGPLEAPAPSLIGAAARRNGPPWLNFIPHRRMKASPVPSVAAWIQNER